LGASLIDDAPFFMPIQQRELQQFSQLELLARQVVEGFITGLHKSPFHGFSVEFAEYRQYNQGESTKHIDWKLYGKTDKLFIKRYEEETNLRCQIVIDHSSSMYFPRESKKAEFDNKLQWSVKAAAAITYMLRSQRDAVGLSIFSDDLELQTPARSSGIHHSALFFEMEQLLDGQKYKEGKKTSAAQNLHIIAEAINKRSLVIIFSDMFENAEDTEHLFAALQHLKHNKHEVIIFHVSDHQLELDFDFENRPYRFIDMETGEELKLQPSEVKAHYVESVQKLFENLKLRCAQYHIDFIEADINKPYAQVLLPYLLKRQSMR
jgi:uncharacterized protein (DUF58 family)